MFLNFTVDFSQIQSEALQCELTIYLFSLASCLINTGFPFPTCQFRDLRRGRAHWGWKEEGKMSKMAVKDQEHLVSADGGVYVRAALLGLS